MTTALDTLKQYTTVVSDSGDIDGIIPSPLLCARTRLSDTRYPVIGQYKPQGRSSLQLRSMLARWPLMNNVGFSRCDYQPVAHPRRREEARVR
jgi:hypothetical protein